MKTEFEEYLRRIDMPNALIERVDNLFQYVQLVCPEEPTTLFASEYLQEDGTRVYDSVFFFSENYVSEAKRFVAETNVDVTPYKGQIYYIELKTQDYELQNPTDKSRVYLEIYMTRGSQINLELKASKENCNYALRILSDVLKPSLV